MNQILQVKDSKKSYKFINFKKIFLFFLIIVIIFGLSVGAYSIYKNIVSGNSAFSEIFGSTSSTINLTQTKDNKLKIEVESLVGIANIKYNWNNGQEEIIEVEGILNLEKTIDMPVGENTIYISVVDLNDKETKKQESFKVDLSKPEIGLSVIGNNIKITITSKVELTQITYQWNDENIKTEDMYTYENRLEFEKKLELPLGTNTLKIVAIDKNGTKTEKEQEIKCITKATTTTEVIGEYWHFKVEGKENITSVEFEINGQKYLMNTDTFGKTKTVHYKVKLVEGTNYLKITSTTQSGGVDVTTWEQEYKPE